MKQILTRVPDSLHALAREESAVRGISLNDFVIAAIEDALAASDRPGASMRHRAAALGLRVAPTLMGDDPPRTPEDVDRRWRETVAALPPDTGDVLLDILLAQREQDPR